MRSDRSTPTESELAALADGSLEHARAEALLKRVNDSPELRATLAEQQRALLLVGAVDAKAPSALHARIEAMVPEPRHTRTRTARRMGFVAAVAIVVALVAVIAIGSSGGGSTTQSVQQTAALALSKATMPAPAESSAHSTELSVSVDGVAFPYWRERFGWRSSGARSDRVDGRTVRTVFYSDGSSRRVGYAIVSGPAWATHGGTLLWRKGVAYRVLSHEGATVVTWQRGGHLCVVSGRGVSTEALVRLAGWSGAKPVAS